MGKKEMARKECYEANDCFPGKSFYIVSKTGEYNYGHGGNQITGFSAYLFL